MPANHFQSHVRKELVRIMGCTPRYSECSKRSGNYRLKWDNWSVEEGIDREVFVNVVRKLKTAISPWLVVKVVEKHAGYDSYINIWIPPSYSEDLRSGLFQTLKSISPLFGGGAEKERIQENLTESLERLERIQTEFGAEIYKMRKLIKRVSELSKNKR